MWDNWSVTISYTNYCSWKWLWENFLISPGFFFCFFKTKVAELLNLVSCGNKAYAISVCPVPNNSCNPLANQILTKVERVVMLDIIIFFKTFHEIWQQDKAQRVRLLPWLKKRQEDLSHWMLLASQLASQHTRASSEYFYSSRLVPEFVVSW